MAGHGGDVIAELPADHREVDELFAQIEQIAPGSAERKRLLEGPSYPQSATIRIGSSPSCHRPRVTSPGDDLTQLVGGALLNLIAGALAACVERSGPGGGSAGQGGDDRLRPAVKCHLATETGQGLPDPQPPERWGRP
jgi:hypothetical protein